MSLRWRIALILAVVAVVVGAASGTAAWLATSAQLRNGIDDTLRSTAQGVNAPDDHGDHGGHAPPGAHCPPPGSFEAASSAQIVASDGTVSSCIDGGVSLPLVSGDAGLSGSAVVLRTVSINGQQYRLLSTPWHEGGTLQIGRSLSESNGVLSGLRNQLLALVAITAAIAALLGWAIATRIARPIVLLGGAAEKIATTLDFTTPVAVRGSGEVRSLARSFTTMIDAVRASHEKQRRLVSDASHEMRTPLTSLRSNVELLGKIERLPEEERQEVVGDVLADIDELSNLLGELVDLASDLASTEDAEPVVLGDIARDVAARTERRVGREVLVNVVATEELVGRPRQLERALSNLVDNAVKYSEAPAPIEVRVEAAKVTVLDRGRGLADEDAGRIFDRFYRATEVRTEPGSGLGLAIVEEIVRSHGGSVFARNREGGGAEIGFSLPPRVASGG